MSQKHELAMPDRTAEAIARVLRTEQGAEASLALARQEANAELERARDDALATVNHALERASRWQHGHAAALADRVEQLRAQDKASIGEAHAPDSAIRTAVERVAARLSGATDADAHDAAR